jgi:hypothetical protein
MYSMKTIKGLLLAGVIGLAGLLAGCGGGGAGGDVPAPLPPSSVSSASSVVLAASSTTVNSADSNTTTITATVLDSSNVVMANQTVQFSASSGVIVATTTTTDANGHVSATFSSGSVEKTNRTAVISASVTGSSVTASIPIQIIGSTLTSTATNASPNVGVAITLTASAKISGGTAAANESLRFSIASSSTGSGTLSATSGTTDSSGNADITFTGTAAGTVDVLIEWLNSSGNTASSTTQTFTVQAVGGAFEVTTPASSPWPVTLGTNQTITVSTPATINGTAVANIRYATTLGTWLSGGLKTLTVSRSGAIDTQTFVPGAIAGNANIQIDALSGAGVVLATAKTLFALSASAASAASIFLQSNVYVLAPSSGGTNSVATLTATVTNISNNAVAGASVLFELVNPTGSGEQIDSVVVSTNSSGVAQSVFTAGTLSTIQTSTIRASVIGSAVAPSDINITVGGTAGSVAIGTSTTITSVNSDTAYQLPVTVMVTDSNGNAVSGATVSLSLWGQSYHKGYRAAVSPCTASWDFSYVNEDLNENLILDAGEDVDGPNGNPPVTPPGLGAPDGALWPPSPAAGSIPATVATGSDGTATFNWIYLKSYASWITARMRASVNVQGSEATSTTTIVLTPSKADVDGCVLPHSPFN